jgi:hypothetical protein
VMNVPITFTNSSGADVAAAMNVAPATSLDMFSAVRTGNDMLSTLNGQSKFLFLSPQYYFILVKKCLLKIQWMISYTRSSKYTKTHFKQSDDYRWQNLVEVKVYTCCGNLTLSVTTSSGSE